MGAEQPVEENRREVVRGGNLITSRTPSDLPAFMREIMQVMRGKELYHRYA
jgi:putative intracellular protease/amidase